jgi:glycosyltransferase involved in cell wall biosynthesis
MALAYNSCERSACRPANHGRKADSRLTEATAPLVSIIVPVFNEAATVAVVIDRLLNIDLPAPREIIVVNDGSTDGTRAALESMTPNSIVRVIHADRNRGKGHAVRQGLSHASGSVVAIQDADLELDPAQLSGLVAPVLRGEVDVVYGSRFLTPTHAPFMTVAGNKLLTAITNLLFGSSLTDMETCYKVMRTDVLRSMTLKSNGFGIEPEITAKVFKRQYRVYEIPITYDGRGYDEGKKITWRDGVVALWVLLKYRFTE